MDALSWLVIADDLTGACDCGAAFARAGKAVTVLLRPGADFPPLTAGAVWVISSNSRGLPPGEAARVVEQVVGRSLAALRPDFLYHKIDSTLRGNPGDELKAIMRVAGIDSALVCPAFPGQGRAVRGGRVWVRGQILEETVFSASAGSGDLLERFGPDAALISPADLIAAEFSSLSARGIIVADAETEDDLSRLASAGLKARIRLWCGSAGLARALAANEPGLPARTAREPLKHRPWLVLAGSQNPVTRRQVARLAEAGAVVFVVGENKGLLRVADYPIEGKPVIFTTPDLVPGQCEDSSQAHRLAELAALALRRFVSEPGHAQMPGLLLTGGDTALAACSVLGCDRIDLAGEVEPGVALGRMRGGMLDGAPVITKAGGFGDPDTLARIVLA